MSCNKNRFLVSLRTGLFALFSCVALISLSAHAKNIDLTAEEKAWITEHNPLVVGGGPDWAPFDFVTPSGEYGGLSWEYLNEIAVRTGLTLEVSVSPWFKNYADTLNGTVDILPAVFLTEERLDHFAFSDPYFRTQEFFFVRKDIASQAQINLSGMRVAVPKGFAQIELLQQNYPEIEIVEVDTISEAIDTVVNKDAELLYETYVTVEYLLEQDQVNTIEPLLSASRNRAQTLHFAVAKDRKILLSILNKGLASINLERRKNLDQQWFSSTFVHPLPLRILSPEQVAWLKANPSLNFGGDPDWLPYEAFTEKGEYIGIVSEFLRFIESTLGYSFNRVPTKTWQETIELLKNDEIDVISELRDSSLSDEVTFTKSYVSSPIIIVMESDNEYVDGIARIEDKRIALVKDYGYVKRIEESFPDIAFYHVDNVQEGLEQVASGKLDAIVMTLAHASYQIAEQGFNNLRIVGQTQFKSELAFGVRKEYEPLVGILNQVIDTISLNERQAALNSWSEEKFAARTDYTTVIQIVLVSFVGLTAILFWNRKLANEINRRKDAEDQTKKLIENMPAQVFVTDLKGKLLSYNTQFTKDFEFSKSDLEDFNVDELYTDFADKDDIIKKLTLQGFVKNKVVKLHGKSKRHIHSLMLSVIPIRFDKKQALLAIAVDLNERLEIENQLRQAKENAEVATKSKSEFLANMSHEIRTPMNAIVGFTELLEKQIDDPKLKSYANIIQSSSQNLLLIVNDILDLSKIESGKLDIEKTPARPQALFDELYEIFKLSINEKGLKMHFQISSDIPEVVLLDIKRLRQVLLNLLGNAIKFTDSGYITLRVEVDNLDFSLSKLNLKIDVQDSGCGIPGHELQTIFEKFHQVKDTTTKEKGGTGLGLPICQRLVSLMGGQLSVSSDIGKGTTFSIHLKDVDVVAVNRSDEESGANLQSRSMCFEPANVLVVDDIKENRMLVAEMLNSVGLNTFEAENGLKAVEFVASNRTDLILMDLRMPVMNGYQAAEAVKTRADIPIIALTASVMPAELERIKDANFDGYLRKPATQSELLDKLSGFLPFEVLQLNETEESTAVGKQLPLTAMPTGLRHELLDIKSLFDEVVVTHDLSLTENYVEAIKDLSEDFQFEPLKQIAEDLLHGLSQFDIGKIEQLLKILQKDVYERD